MNAQTASNGRAFLFEFPTPLLRIICHFTGGNSSFPFSFSPLLPCSRRPTDSRLDRTFDNRPPPPPPPCNPAEIVVKFHLFRRRFRVELIKRGKKERKKFFSRTIIYVCKRYERERERESK